MNRPKLPLMDLLEVFSVGLPFCGFKLLTGLFCLTIDSVALRLLGILLLGMGILDCLINLTNFAGLLIKRDRPLEACLITVFTKRFGENQSEHSKRDFGNSLDILLSFSIVAIMVGGGLLSQFPENHLLTWNACVVLNVLGAGISRLAGSLKKS